MRIYPKPGVIAISGKERPGSRIIYRTYKKTGRIYVYELKHPCVPDSPKQIETRELGIRARKAVGEGLKDPQTRAEWQKKWQEYEDSIASDPTQHHYARLCDFAMHWVYQEMKKTK